MNRKFISRIIRSRGYGYNTEEIIKEVPKAQANCVISRLDDALPLHAPCLDIDLPCRLYESKTPGHYHLYIDRPVLWHQYKKLLKALAEAGLIEKGWYRAALRDGYTTLDFTVERTPVDYIVADLESM